MRLPPVHVLCLLAAVSWVGACGTSPLVVPEGDVTDAAAAPVADARPASSRVTRALAVLHRWDSRRAAAYASGDARLLRQLYVRGSVAGARDARTLREYAARGLVVADLTMQVLEAHVLEESPTRVRVHLVERVAPGTATLGRSEVELPSGRPRGRTVTLVRSGGRWLVRSVRAGDVSPRGR